VLVRWDGTTTSEVVFAPRVEKPTTTILVSGRGGLGANGSRTCVRTVVRGLGGGEILARTVARGLGGGKLLEVPKSRPPEAEVNPPEAERRL
jgi:hypothetical protein